jgi:arylsulfatase B
MQGKQTIQQGCSWGLGLDEITFPSALQASGWDTHMVGKSHLGADYWRRTPTYRGFNSFFGYLYGAEDYYTHKLAGFFDLRKDTRAECGPGCSQPIGPLHNNTYSPFLFSAEVVRLIEEAGKSTTPTYIHFTPQSVHAPLEAPAEFIAPYLPIFGKNNTARATHAGALACLDAAIANITAAIAAAGLGADTLIYMSSDNGGPMGDIGDGTMASNYPLRGGKHSLYEGGVNVAAFVWGPSFVGSGVNRTWRGLSHVTDVGMTLLEAAGVEPLPHPPTQPIHGVSFWTPLTTASPSSARKSVVINIDYTTPLPQAAIVTQEGWKLILGKGGDDTCNYWSDPFGEKETPSPGVLEEWAPSSITHSAPPPPSPMWPLSDMTPTLYNLTVDPRETQNVTALYPEVVAALIQELSVWGASVAVPVVENPTPEPASNPGKYFNGSWTPWKGM